MAQDGNRSLRAGFLFLLSSGAKIQVLIKEYLREKHTEKIVPQLPQAERCEFIDLHLAE